MLPELHYLSICSGIESATVAWRGLGFRAIAFSETDPFCRCLLTHHYPDVPNRGDVHAHHDWPACSPDIVVGGTPCQSFSFAGQRRGLNDERGRLTRTFFDVIADKAPEWFVWENVPGVLSLDSGRVFGALLGRVAELGYRYAYRVLDAKYFGVPQSRRRVFVVGHSGDWRAPAAVLFDRESLRGNPPKSRKAGQDVSKELTTGSSGNRWDARNEMLLAFSNRQDPDVREIAPSCEAKGNGNAVHTGTQVRRLTPREWERLQGFPDDYTLIPYRGKPAKDSPRYRAIGNSMAVPVMRWIGERLQRVHELLREGV